MASDLNVLEPGLGALFGVGGGGFNAPDVSSVEQLLTLLPMLQAQPAPRMKPYQNILGGLSDALLNYATVRQGGGPVPGPYASRVHAQREQARQEAAAAERFNRETEAKVRIGAFQTAQEGEVAERVARVRAENRPLRQFSAIIEGPDGKPMSVNVTTDFEGNVVNVQRVGKRFVRKNTVAGTVGGQEGLYTVDPTESTAQQVTTGAPTSAPGGAPVPPGAPLGRPTTAEEKDAIDSTFVLLDKLGRAEGAAPKQRGPVEDFAVKLGEQGLRAIPGGPQVLGRFDPNAEILAATLKDVESIMQLLRTGKVANEGELKRLRGITPQLADVSQPEVFMSKLNNFKREAAMRLQARATRSPSQFTPEQLKAIEQYLSETETGEGEIDEIDRMADELGL